MFVLRVGPNCQSVSQDLCGDGRGRQAGGRKLLTQSIEKFIIILNFTLLISFYGIVKVTLTAFKNISFFRCFLSIGSAP